MKLYQADKQLPFPYEPRPLSLGYPATSGGSQSATPNPLEKDEYCILIQNINTNMHTVHRKDIFKNIEIMYVPHIYYFI